VVSDQPSGQLQREPGRGAGGLSSPAGGHGGPRSPGRWPPGPLLAGAAASGPGCPWAWQRAANAAWWLLVCTKSDDGFCFFGGRERRRFDFRVLFSVLI